jgi:hypothetical protein
MSYAIENGGMSNHTHDNHEPDNILVNGVHRAGKETNHCQGLNPSVLVCSVPKEMKPIMMIAEPFIKTDKVTSVIEHIHNQHHAHQ